jgi:ATP-dependent DNA ligase
VLDENGWPSFNAIQNHMRLRREGRLDRIRFIPFDLLEDETGKDLMKQPYIARRLELEVAIVGAEDGVMASPHMTNGRALWHAVEERNLEGLIVKTAMGLYHPGRRDETWQKVKRTVRRSFHVVGWTEGMTAGALNGEVGALILAEPEGDGWRYVCKVGTGFKDRQRSRVFELFRELARQDPVFDKRQMLTVRPKVGSRPVVWLDPELAAVIEYSDTEGGAPRWPSFKGMYRGQEQVA